MFPGNAIGLHLPPQKQNKKKREEFVKNNMKEPMIFGAHLPGPLNDNAISNNAKTKYVPKSKKRGRTSTKNTRGNDKKKRRSS